MKARPAFDVSRLPVISFQHRDPLWWGVAVLIAIESTAFSLLLLTYFYLRDNVPTWPPAQLSKTSFITATIGLLLLLASCIPTHLANKAAERADVPGIKRQLMFATAIAIVFLAMRAIELDAVPFLWDSHSYGSIYWITFSMHSLHALTGVAENYAILVILERPQVEKKRLGDAHNGGFYWYFMVASLIPIYVVFYLDPALLAVGFVG
jgi:cytochrome c oxidase subunit III